MSLPVKMLPTLDGSRAAAVERLSAWLRDCRDEEVDAALYDMLGEIDELVELASHKADELDQAAADKHRERIHDALDVVAHTRDIVLVKSAS